MHLIAAGRASCTSELVSDDRCAAATEADRSVPNQTVQTEVHAASRYNVSMRLKQCKSASKEYGLCVTAYHMSSSIALTCCVNNNNNNNAFQHMTS